MSGKGVPQGPPLGGICTAFQGAAAQQEETTFDYTIGRFYLAICLFVYLAKDTETFQEKIATKSKSKGRLSQFTSPWSPEFLAITLSE